MKKVIINSQNLVIAFVDTDKERINTDIEADAIKDCSTNDWKKDRAKTWKWTKSKLIAFVEPAPDPEIFIAQLTNAAQLVVQELLDDKAQERNYSNIMSLCTYATSEIEKFKKEGQAGVKWRDQAWAALYKLQVDISSGKMAAPSSIEQSKALALSVLPAMQWADEMMEAQK